MSLVNANSEQICHGFVQLVLHGGSGISDDDFRNEISVQVKEAINRVVINRMEVLGSAGVFE